MKNKLINIEDASILCEYSNSTEDREISKYMYKNFSKQYQEDRKEHNKLHKEHRHNRQVKPSFGSWGEMVFTFSEAIDHDLHNKYSEEELIKIAHNCALELCKEMKTELRMMNIDFDEKRPHFQMFFKNFDEKGASIYYKHKTKEFMSKMQDIAFKNFGKLGMERGISKEIRALEDDSKKLAFDYKTTKQYYKEQEIKARSVISDLVNDKNLILKDVNNLKNLRKEISNDVNLSNEEKKSKHKEISKLQKELRALNKENISKIKKLESFDLEVDKDIDEILKYSKKRIGYDDSKLKEILKFTLKEYSNISIELDEKNALKQEYEALKAEFNKLKDDSIKKDLKIKDFEELDKEKTIYIKQLKAKDENNARFTNKEVAQVTIKYENEIQDLKSDILDLKIKFDKSIKENIKAKEIAKYIEENHQNIVEEFEDQKKNKYFSRNR
jgi:hypothetical protein